MADFEVELEGEVLTITPDSPSENEEKFMLALTDALFWKDLYYYHSGQDGWQYIVSSNHQLVFPMDDYGYDLIRRLYHGDRIDICGRPNQDYEEYEWNDEN